MAVSIVWHGIRQTSEVGVGHSPASAPGGRRKANRSRSGCILLEGCPVSWCVCLLWSGFKPSGEEGRNGRGLDSSQSHSAAGMVGFVTQGCSGGLPTTDRELGEGRILQANVLMSHTTAESVLTAEMGTQGNKYPRILNPPRTSISPVRQGHWQLPASSISYLSNRDSRFSPLEFQHFSE